MSTAESLIAETQTTLKAYNRDEERADALSVALAQYENAQTAVTKSTAAEKEARKIFKQAFPNACPLCGKANV